MTYVIFSPLTLMLPVWTKFELPYKDARFILDRAMDDGPAKFDIVTDRRAKTMTILREFNRTRDAGPARAKYFLRVKACNPGAEPRTRTRALGRARRAREDAMNDFDIRLNAFVIVFLAVFGAVIALNLYWGISSHFIWASRVRRLLEQEGFTVREMERRWLTKGPFTDIRTPGAKHHKDWLIRLVAVDREHRPRAGWVRWRRALPWQSADQWTVRWDEGPWSGDSGYSRERKRGLSTAVFMALILPPSLAGAAIGVYLLVRGFQERQSPNDLAPQQTVGASASNSGVSTATGYEIRCRGGGESYRVDQLSAGPRIERGVEVLRVLLSFEFKASPLAAGADAGGLLPGTCGWIDRPLNEAEPRVIRFETPALVTPGQPGNLRPLPGMFPADEHLRDAMRYWSFFVFNTNQGFLQATRYGPWDSGTAKRG